MGAKFRNPYPGDVTENRGCGVGSSRLTETHPEYGQMPERLRSGLQPRVHGFESRSALRCTQEKLSKLGAVAHLGERFVRNEEVEGSSPFSSTVIN